MQNAQKTINTTIIFCAFCIFVQFIQKKYFFLYIFYLKKVSLKKVRNVKYGHKKS